MRLVNMGGLEPRSLFWIGGILYQLKCKKTQFKLYNSHWPADDDDGLRPAASASDMCPRQEISQTPRVLLPASHTCLSYSQTPQTPPISKNFKHTCISLLQQRHTRGPQKYPRTTRKTSLNENVDRTKVKNYNYGASIIMRYCIGHYGQWGV